MKRIFQLFFSLFILIICVQQSYAQTSIPQAQAIFTYNFTRLIEWPGDYKTGDFVIETYGNGEFYNEIKNYVKDKSVGSQKIVVKNVSNIDEIGKCHILFVNFGKAKEIPSIISKIGSSKTLIISDKRGSLDDGAGIYFAIIEDKLKYEVKASNITRMGLKYNSILENMAYAKH